MFLSTNWHTKCIDFMSKIYLRNVFKYKIVFRVDKSSLIKELCSEYDFKIRHTEKK